MKPPQFQPESVPLINTDARWIPINLTQKRKIERKGAKKEDAKKIRRTEIVPFLWTCFCVFCRIILISDLWGKSKMPKRKIYSRNQLAEILRREKERGRVIVTTNGCFDLLHVGHLRYLQAARELGDLLVVGLNSDTSVRVIKGENRPLVPENERAEMLAGLGCVDYVTIFSELEPSPLLSQLKPDIHVKGGDYTIEQLPEREVVEAHGGKVIVGLNVPGKSTTDLIQVIRKRYGLDLPT